MTLTNEYFDLTKKYKLEYGKKTIVLMQVGAFYEVYAIKHINPNDGSYEYRGSDIVEFSNMCDLAIANKKTNIAPNQQVVMSGFRDYQIAKYLEKLEEYGYTSVVFRQDLQGKTMLRSLDKIYSPGTYFSNNTKKITNNICTIWIHSYNFRNIEYIIIGIANIDIFTGKVSLFEYKNEYFHNPTTFNCLESFISIYDPSEVIFIYNVDHTKAAEICNYAGINCKSLHMLKTNESEKIKNCEKQTYIDKIILNTFTEVDQEIYACEIARQSLCYLLDFINEHNPDLIKNINPPVLIRDEVYLSLENHSLSQLNILDSKQHSGKLSSVLSFLNNCITPMGRRLFHNLLTTPIISIEKLQSEYDAIEYGLTQMELINKTNKDLYEIKDIEKLNRKIIIKTIQPIEFFHFYKTLLKIKDIISTVNNHNNIKNYLTFKLDSYKDIIPKTEKIIQDIETYLDCDYLNSLAIEDLAFDCKYFKSTVDSDLRNKIESYNDSKKIITAVIQYLNKIIKKYEKKDAEFIKLHYTEKTPPTLQITKRRAQILRKHLNNESQEIIYDTDSQLLAYNLNTSVIKFITNKNNEIIVSEQLNQLTNNIFSLKEEIAVLNREVFNKMLLVFSDKYKDFISLSNACSFIDIYQNNVRMAESNNYTKPTVVENENSYLKIMDLRHPLIENLQNDELYVTNNIKLGVDDIDSQNGILLYGTNAVGKTSLIKSIGIAVIMAQAGLYVPCTEMELSPYHYIFTRILGNDNLFKGLSTFAVEMSELRTILKKANNKSLILGDELCSGTESDSAISIFIAGLLELHNRNSNFIFATHFHEIVDYQEIREMNKLKLYHMAVIYNPEEKKLIYDRKLKTGPGDSMYGLEVCKSLDLPFDFLNMAYNIRNKYNTKSQGILSKKTSKYNSKKIIDKCEICKINNAEDVHHLQFQKNSNNRGYINTFNKNHLANLVSICKVCHDKIHRENIELKQIKTSKGTEFKKL